MSEGLREELEREARAAGFSAFGVTAPGAMAAETEPALTRFLEAGMHGEMGWMAERTAWRGDPRALWPAARSVIMLGENYGPEADPMALLSARERGVISVYAQGKDYHDLVKKRLKRVGRRLVALTGAEIKVFVDTAPVMEKPLAEAAGLGWRGKHTNLVSRDFGSWLFLGAIFTTAEIAPDARHGEHCGTCRRCLDICPTAAFPEPFRLDARRCISYLTIELKGPIPRPMRPLIGNRIYGCDDCLAVCPWNRFAERAAEIGYHAREGMEGPLLAELAALDEAGFRARFAGSPVKRIGRARLLRNVLVAIGNSASPGLAPAAEARLSDEAPLVRGAAVWALSRLLPRAALSRLRQPDPDREVEAEWEAALSG